MFNKIYANFKTKVESLQEITTFLSEKIGQKNHFAPHPTWSKDHFDQVDLDLSILVGVFLTRDPKMFW
jgi:hypothetical protein